MTDRSLSAEAVREVVRTGEATQLLGGFDVGPTWYADRWWYVPADAPDGADYQPADADLSERFERLRVRAERIDDVANASE